MTQDARVVLTTNPDVDPADDLLTVAETVAYLAGRHARNLNERTVRSYADNGTRGFPSGTSVGRTRMFRRGDLDTWATTPRPKRGRPRAKDECPDADTHVARYPCPRCGRHAHARPRHQLAGQWATARQRQNVAHLMTEDRAVCGALVPGPIAAADDVPHCEDCQRPSSTSEQEQRATLPRSDRKS